MIIYLLSGPRNFSTALMYSFNQRSDMTVMDEPFYPLWLKRIDKTQPHYEAIIAKAEDPDKIHDKIEENEKIT